MDQHKTGQNIVRLSLEASMPKELFQKFIQLVRDFDEASKDACHFEMGSECALETDEVLDIINSIDPPFKYQQITPRSEIKGA